MKPNDALLGLPLAPPQFGWFKTSKASIRNCNLLFSVMGKFLRRPASKYQTPGLVRLLRGWIPKVPHAGAVQTGSCPLAQPRVCPLAHLAQGLNPAAVSALPVRRAVALPASSQEGEARPALTP